MRAILICLLLAGCSSLGDFSTGMRSLVGQPATAAFARLGYPDRQQVIAGNTVYYYGTDQPTGPSCTFKLVVDPSGIVRSWDGLGNSSGCRLYLNGLRH